MDTIKLKKDKVGTYFVMKVDPYQGMAAFIASIRLDEYRTVGLDRKKTTAKVYVEKI